MPASSYAAFSAAYDFSAPAVYHAFYERNRSRIAALREASAVANLTRIIDATFRISARCSFQGMGLRDLSHAVGMSLGALYRYIGSKELLAQMILEHTQDQVHGVLGSDAIACLAPRARLATLLRLHLYLSESLLPWFYFSYMEARVLPAAERQRALSGEQSSEDLLYAAIVQGQQDGSFDADRDARLSAAILKAPLQDWYLKRGKYRRRELDVDRYADALTDWTLHYLDAPLAHPNPSPSTGVALS